MRIAILGAGGVGGYFGGRWAEAGLDVTFLARGAHLEAIRARGLFLESPLGDRRIDVPVAESAGEVGEVDVVVLATKSWQLRDAAESMGPLVGSGTLVFGLQNGLEAAAVLSEVVPPSRVMGATCRIISLIRAPGVIQHVGVAPTIAIGDLPGSRPGGAEDLRRELGGADGMTLGVEVDIQAEIWRKFLFFAPVSGIGSLTRAPIGVFRSIPLVRTVLEAAVQEVFSVARARGIDLPASSVADAMRFIDGAPHEGTTSMQRDFRDGRRTELEELSGAVVRFGAQAGIEVPVHSLIYSALLPQELRARGTLPFSVS